MIKANRRKNIMTMIWMAISVFVLVFIWAYSYN
jgi:predicted nucleic acid-binding Zn ribbon protein